MPRIGSEIIRPRYVFLSFALLATILIFAQSVPAASTSPNIVQIKIGGAPYSLAVTPNGKYVYVTDQNDRNLYIINTTTDTFIRTIGHSTCCQLFRSTYVTINAAGTYVYASNTTGTLNFINTINNSVIYPGIGSLGPIYLSVPENGSLLYAAGILYRGVKVINTTTRKIAYQITLPSSPSLVQAAPNGKTVYAISSNTLFVINAAKKSISNTIPIGSDIGSVSISSDGSRLYLGASASNYIYVFNTATNSIERTISLAATPSQLASGNGYIYATFLQNDNISVITPETGITAQNMELVAQPYALALSPQGSTIYATSPATGNLMVISISNQSAQTATTTIPGGIVSGISATEIYRIEIIAIAAIIIIACLAYMVHRRRKRKQGPDYVTKEWQVQ
jgi:YVTN family beta-propeller protein